MKEVANTQYIACMNPTAGSFHITPRMQRHFVTLAVHMPCNETIRCYDYFPYLERIYTDSSQAKRLPWPVFRGVSMTQRKKDAVKASMDSCHNADMRKMWCRYTIARHSTLVYIL